MDGPDTSEPGAVSFDLNDFELNDPAINEVCALLFNELSGDSDCDAVQPEIAAVETDTNHTLQQVEGGESEVPCNNVEELMDEGDKEQVDSQEGADADMKKEIKNEVVHSERDEKTSGRGGHICHICSQPFHR